MNCYSPNFQGFILMKNALNNQVGMLGDMFLWLVANLKQGVIYFIKQALPPNISAGSVCMAWVKSYITLSVLRIFVHSVSCHFSCENSCNSNFSVKLQHSLLDFCYLTIFSDLVLIINFNSNFLLEAGQILERSQWIQIH